MHKGAAFPATIKLCHPFLTKAHNAGGIGVDGPVFPHVGVGPWTVPVALLADEDFSGLHDLATEALYASALGDTISAVLGGATSFLVGHSGEIVRISPPSARKNPGEICAV